MTTSPKVWVITGTSSGLGASIARSAIARGDLVVATARNPASNQHVAGAKTLKLDVTSTFEELQAIAREAVALYGRVDVLVNNAGYPLISTVEEASTEEVLKQFNTNVFGLLNVTNTFLPYFRAQNSGTVINIGSVAGRVSFPSIGHYGATKLAVVAITESLAAELAKFNIRVSVVEPGSHHTDVALPERLVLNKETIPDYEHIHSTYGVAFKSQHGTAKGDPDKAGDRIVDLVRGEGLAGGKHWPVRVLLGTNTIDLVKSGLEAQIKAIEEWEEWTNSTALDKKE